MIEAEDLHEIVMLKYLSDAMMRRIHKNYKEIIGINSGLIVLGVAGWLSLIHILIGAAVLVVLVGGAVAYLIRAKRRGVKCVGCPAGGTCHNSQKVKMCIRDRDN